MRFDTPIYFQRIQAGEYDQTTGNYTEDVITEEKRDASVTDTGAETLNLIYGEIKQDVVTIRLQNHYGKPFDRIRIGNKYYRADKSRTLRVKQVIIASEVP